MRLQGWEEFDEPVDRIVSSEQDVVEFSQSAGFSVERIQLRPQYARTLHRWAAKLVARRDDAIAIASEEVYDRDLHYLTGCADFFCRGICNVGQFTLLK